MSTNSAQSQLFAKFQSNFAVETEIPSVAAACSFVSPAKKRSLTSCAARESLAAN